MLTAAAASSGAYSSFVDGWSLPPGSTRLGVTSHRFQHLRDLDGTPEWLVARITIEIERREFDNLLYAYHSVAPSASLLRVPEPIAYIEKYGCERMDHCLITRYEEGTVATEYWRERPDELRPLLKSLILQLHDAPLPAVSEGLFDIGGSRPSPRHPCVKHGLTGYPWSSFTRTEVEGWKTLRAQFRMTEDDFADHAKLGVCLGNFRLKHLKIRADGTVLVTNWRHACVLPLEFAVFELIIDFRSKYLREIGMSLASELGYSEEKVQSFRNKISSVHIRGRCRP